MICIIGPLVVIILICIMIYIASCFEARDFNGGICKRCNSRLQYFDTDSQGGRGYNCPMCNYETWVSYNRVDKDFTSS